MKKLFILSFIITLSLIMSRIIYAQDTTMGIPSSSVSTTDPPAGNIDEERTVEDITVEEGIPLPVEQSDSDLIINEKIQTSTSITQKADNVKTETTESANINQDFSTDSTKLISMIDKSTSYQYIPVGKPDPFRPIFRKRTDSQKDNKALTPLQRFDLGQLELTTIITGKFGYKALVMDPTGKGYIVTSGTLIGNNNGKVSDISGIRLIVDEQLHDRFGNVKNSRRYLEMKGDKK